jgi:hypothetical protein
VRKIAPVKLWKWEPENLPSVKHSARTAIAVTVSFMIARLFQLPEASWAVIATLLVMPSTLGAIPGYFSGTHRGYCVECLGPSASGDVFHG